MVVVSYLVHYDFLLQNATDIITKCDSYFITKWDKSSLQNVSALFLRNSTVWLQDVTAIIKGNDFITKCVSTYIVANLKQMIKKARRKEKVT